MNIFIKELKAHRRSLIIWSIVMLFMIVAGMGKFSTFSTSGQNMNELLEHIPSSMKAVLGLNYDITTAIGYYQMLYLYLLVMVAAHASMLGSNIISKEEKDKTAEFLLTKPISRRSIISSKLLAALVNILILNIITLILSVMTVGSYSKGESIASKILLLMHGMFILQIMFLFIGSLIASFSKNPKISDKIAAIVLLFTFVLSAIIDINKNLEPFKYLTPFKYFDAKSVISNGLDPVFMLLSIVIIIVSVSSTYIFYKKRDITI